MGNIERLQIVIGIVAILVFAYLSIDIKGSGHDIPPNVQLLLSLIFAAVMARGAVKSENVDAMKEKIFGKKDDKKEEEKKPEPEKKAEEVDKNVN